MIPLINDMAVGLGLSPADAQIDVLWWALALGACLGGNGTLIGASANVIVAGIASREGHKFSYMDFLKVGFPIMIVSLIISHIYIYVRYLMHKKRSDNQGAFSLHIFKLNLLVIPHRLISDNEQVNRQEH